MGRRKPICRFCYNNIDGDYCDAENNDIFWDVYDAEDCDDYTTEGPRRDYTEEQWRDIHDSDGDWC